MELNEYGNQAHSTCMESCDNVAYPLFALIEETGELIEKVTKIVAINEDSHLSKSAEIVLQQMAALGQAAQFISKAVRHGTTDVPVYIDYKQLKPSTTEMNKSEVGDVLWNLNELSRQLSFTLNDAAAYNLKKLADRKKRNEIDANGDTVRTKIE